MDGWARAGFEERGCKFQNLGGMILSQRRERPQDVSASDLHRKVFILPILREWAAGHFLMTNAEKGPALRSEPMPGVCDHTREGTGEEDNMAVRIMKGTDVVGTVAGHQPFRRLLQKAKAYRRSRSFWGTEELTILSSSVIKVGDKTFWLFDDEDRRTAASEGLSVCASCNTYGGHGPGDFDTRGGYKACRIAGKDVVYEFIDSVFIGGTERDATKWAHNYGTPLPSVEELESLEVMVANSPMYFQAYEQNVCL